METITHAVGARTETARVAPIPPNEPADALEEQRLALRKWAIERVQRMFRTCEAPTVAPWWGPGAERIIAHLTHEGTGLSPHVIEAIYGFEGCDFEIAALLGRVRDAGGNDAVRRATVLGAFAIFAWLDPSYGRDADERALAWALEHIGGLDTSDDEIDVMEPGHGFASHAFGVCAVSTELSDPLRDATWLVWHLSAERPCERRWAATAAWWVLDDCVEALRSDRRPDEELDALDAFLRRGDPFEG